MGTKVLKIFEMCFCDGYCFLITNKTSGEKHLINGDETLYKFFEGRYSLPCLFHRLLKKEHVQLNGVLHGISYNSHPECQRVKMELVKILGVEDFELWKCPEHAESYVFDLGIRWEHLTYKERKHCMFLTRNIHKLPFGVSRESNPIPLVDLNNIVKQFYERVKRNESSTIGYKGGHLERNLLNELKIPAINLEVLGCPKAETLFNKLVWLENCGQHIGKDPYRHCPKVEVEAFGTWLEEQRI